MSAVGLVPTALILYSSPLPRSVHHQYNLCYVSAHKFYSQIKTVLHILHYTTQRNRWTTHLSCFKRPSVNTHAEGSNAILPTACCAQASCFSSQLVRAMVYLIQHPAPDSGSRRACDPLEGG